MLPIGCPGEGSPHGLQTVACDVSQQDRESKQEPKHDLGLPQGLRGPSSSRYWPQPPRYEAGVGVELGLKPKPLDVDVGTLTATPGAPCCPEASTCLFLRTSKAVPASRGPGLALFLEVSVQVVDSQLNCCGCDAGY